MKTNFLLKLLLAFVAVTGLFLLVSPRKHAAPIAAVPLEPAEELPVERPGARITAAKPALINAPPAPGAVVQALSQSINQFIANAHPFGLDQPVAASDILRVTTNGNGHLVEIETERHIYEFQGATPRFFKAMLDGQDTRRDPSAVSLWYQANAPWTKEEAIQETHALMKRLGIKATVERVEYDATPFRVKNAAGEQVEVTLFHNVWFHMTNDIGALQAQYRMGTAGPGRLVLFFSTVR